jgi:hypothetical protein
VVYPEGIPINLNHFAIRANDSGNWDKDWITETELKKLLAERINTVRMNYVINDISRFIRNPKVLEIWSPEYFHHLASQLKTIE